MLGLTFPFDPNILHRHTLLTIIWLLLLLLLLLLGKHTHA
jgi:hypothetical protein